MARRSSSTWRWLPMMVAGVALMGIILGKWPWRRTGLLRANPPRGGKPPADAPGGSDRPGGRRVLAHTPARLSSGRSLGGGHVPPRRHPNWVRARRANTH